MKNTQDREADYRGTNLKNGPPDIDGDLYGRTKRGPVDGYWTFNGGGWDNGMGAPPKQIVEQLLKVGDARRNNYKLPLLVELDVMVELNDGRLIGPITKVTRYGDSLQIITVDTTYNLATNKVVSFTHTTI